MKQIEESRCLYATLRLPKDATTSAIKRAYRELCVTLHPDKNDGKVLDEFYEVKLAYEVLSDPTRRAEYDESGSYSERNKEFEAARLFIDKFCEAVFEVKETENPITLVRLTMKLEIDEHRKKISDMKKVQKHYRKMAKRINAIKGENAARRRLENEADEVDTAIALKDSRIELLEMSIEYSKNYEFDTSPDVDQLLLNTQSTNLWK